MEKKIFRNVFVESANTVFANAEILSMSDYMIQFVISKEQYEKSENALIKSGINMSVLMDGNILLTVSKRKSNFEILKKSTDTYDNVCNSIENLKQIKQNNTVLFNNPGISTTEKMTADYIVLALEYLTRAKECLRDLHYDK